MTAARVAGLPSATCSIGRFGAEHTLVVERFDRIVTADGTVIPLHQEDMAQALGVTRLRKYESRGGPRLP